MSAEELEFLDEVIWSGNTDHPAVVSDQGNLTYGQLRTFASYLGDVIRETDAVEPNETAVIYMDKRPEAVIAVFGVLLSGAAYVPVDISLPSQKLNYIIDSCRPSVIITTSDLVERLLGMVSSECRGKCLTLDVREEGGVGIRDMQSGGCYDVSEISPVAQPERQPRRNSRNLAYTIFTSGSSGKPKGVLISHASAAAFVRSAFALNLYREDTRFLNISPFYFDATILDLFAVLGAGGTLVLMKKMIRPHDIVVHMDRHKITDTLMVSSLLRIFASRYSNLHHYQLPHLRSIWYGAEACPVDILRGIKSHLPGITFIHGYGPTETTHTATLLRFDDIDDRYVDYMPIGFPLPTIKTVIRDDSGSPVGVGGVGELFIGGPQVMEGYINDAERTGDVLAPDPIGGDGKRLYRTGDLVGLNEYGQYVFKGRRDDLVKVGGNLVSLNEIENALLSHRCVKDAIVLTMEDHFFNNRLVAFLSAKDPDITEKDLIDFLGGRLAGYMIPQGFIFMEEKELPRTPNGKVDRAALVDMARRRLT